MEQESCISCFLDIQPDYSEGIYKKWVRRGLFRSTAQSLQSKTQITDFSLLLLCQHHLIFCQIPIKVEGNQSKLRSLEGIGFDATVSQTVEPTV